MFDTVAVRGGRSSQVHVGDQRHNRLSGEFIRGIAEHALSRGTRITDDSLPVDYSDDVQRVLEQGPEFLFAPAHRLHRAFALGGVPHRAHNQVPISLALDQVILRAFADGLHRRFGIVAPGEHNYRKLGRFGLYLLNTLEPVGVGQR